MVLGDRVDRLRVPWLGRRVAASAGEEGPLWRRAVLAVMRRPAISLIATTVAAAGARLPGARPAAWAPPGTSSLPNDTVAKQGLLALQRDFPSGATDPVNVVVDGSPNDAGVAAGPDAPARRARRRPRLRRPRADGRERAARSPWPPCRSPSSRAASARRPPSTACATTTCRAAFGAAADRVFVGGAPAEARDSFAVDAGWLPIVIAFVLDAELRPADARLPVDRDPADRDRRQPAVRRRRLRDPRARLPERRRRRPARLHAGRAHRRVGADLPVQRAVRALDGLPGVPAQPHPRALDARPATPPARSSTASPPPRG